MTLWRFLHFLARFGRKQNNTIMDPIVELNSQLDAAIADVNTLAAKSDATTEQIDAASAKINSVKSRIEAVQNANAAKSWQNETPATARDTTTVIVNAGGSDAVKTAGAKGKVGETEIDIFTGQIVQESGAGLLSNQQLKSVLNPAFTEGFKSWARAGGTESNMKGKKAANDAFLEGRDNEGGLFVPAELVAGIIHREPTPTQVVDFVRTIAVSSDQAQLIKANYDSDDLYSSAVRIYKTGEAQAAQKSDKPQFGLKRVDVHGWTGEISVSKRLLEDTNFDIMGYFAGEFRTANRNMTAQKVLLGSGVGEHFGIITRALSGKDGPEIIKSGDATKLTWDSLRKIKNALRSQYNKNARYLFNQPSTLDAIEEFKDADGRDLWPESQRAGGENDAPGRLRGHGYALEDFMPDIAANAIPLLYGDFLGYARVLRMGMTIQVLREIEARNGQVVFLVEMREGGDLIEPWRLKALQIKA